MAASANPPSGGHSNAGNVNSSSLNSNGGGQDDAGGAGGLSATENSVVGHTKAGLRHNPGLSLDWTPEEQVTLEDLLTKYGSEKAIVCYAKISQALRDKTIRDVALRCRWMSKKENGKRRKDDSSSSRKNKDKKENATDPLQNSSQVSNHYNGPPYVQSMNPMDVDDGIPFKDIGGTVGQLLEQNAQALDQISANFSACKIHENIGLFCQARGNLLKILNDCTDMPEIMKRMPPLTVKPNEDLINLILGKTSLPTKS